MVKPKFAIAGLGVINGVGLGHSSRTLQAEAARRAILDAGLRRQDIDGAINGMGAGGSMPGGGGWPDAFSRVLGLPANFYWSVGRGGTGSFIAMMAAMQALELGLAKYVVVADGYAAWSNLHGKLQSNMQTGIRLGSGNTILGNELLGFGSAASFHVLFATRHMHEYGTTSAQFGAVAAQTRQWACLNPEAQMYGKPITVEDHQASPMTIEPYHVLDYCLHSDVGVAYILTSAERARDLAKPAVDVMGLGFGEHARQQWWDKTNYTQLDVAQARNAAFGQAGIELADIDVAQLYDCFTAEVIFQLEDYGWCKKGEGGPFVETGAIGPGGAIPVNTGGGQLSGFYMFDYTGLAEGVRQVRGEAGERQVKDARISLVTGHGGELLVPGMCSTHATAILGRA